MLCDENLNLILKKENLSHFCSSSVFHSNACIIASMCQQSIYNTDISLDNNNNINDDGLQN